MDIFEFRNSVIQDYSNFARSFTRVHADDLKEYLNTTYDQQYFWRVPLIKLNPRFEYVRTIEKRVQDDVSASSRHTDFCMKAMPGKRFCSANRSMMSSSV